MQPDKNVYSPWFGLRVTPVFRLVALHERSLYCSISQTVKTVKLLLQLTKHRGITPLRQT